MSSSYRDHTVCPERFDSAKKILEHNKTLNSLTTTLDVQISDYSVSTANMFLASTESGMMRHWLNDQNDWVAVCYRCCLCLTVQTILISFVFCHKITRMNYISKHNQYKATGWRV